MSELAKNLSSVSWWVSVVVVGVVLNLVSAYLKPWLDRLGGSMSTTLRDHSKRTHERHEQWIELLRTDQHAQLLMHAREARLRQRSIQFFLFAIVLFVFGMLDVGAGGLPKANSFSPYSMFLFGTGGLSFFLGYWSMDDAAICSRLLRRALKDYPLPFSS